MESTSQEATSAGDLKLIPNIKYLFDCPFYWGEIDKDKVMSMFEGKSDGRFLLKDSEGDISVLLVEMASESCSNHA